MRKPDWITSIETVRFRSAPGVMLGITMKCWCGRNMKQQKGDTEGWYCRKHGLQCYEIETAL